MKAESESPPQRGRSNHKHQQEAANSRKQARQREKATEKDRHEAEKIRVRQLIKRHVARFTARGQGEYLAVLADATVSTPRGRSRAGTSPALSARGMTIQ